MLSSSGNSSDGQADTAAAAPVHCAPLTTSAERQSVEEQGAVLFALHNDLLQHQQSVSQAFTTLDQACCALVAAMAARPAAPHKTADPLHSADVDGAPTSPLRGFASLLRQVEALHHFLFTNLYMHQRESTLRLVAGVERAVLYTSSSSGSGSSTTIDAAGWEELRGQTAQLRHHLTHTPLTLIEGRVSLPGGGSLRASTRAPPDTPHHTTTDSAATSDASALSASVVEMNAPVTAALPQRVLRRDALRIFALSAAFAAAGEDGQQSLQSVLQIAQQRFRVHAVILAASAAAAAPHDDLHTAAAAEVELALQLHCMCLVVPHAARGFYPAQPRIVMLTDRLFLSMAAAQPQSDGEEGEELNGGWDVEEEKGEGGPSSALDALFLSLEADQGEYAVDTAPWSPPTSAAAADAAVDTTIEATAVARAALKRHRRTSPHRAKRLRADGAGLQTSSSTSSGTVISVSLPHSPHTQSDLSMDPAPESSTREPGSGTVALGDDIALSGQPPLVSQHIGYTQHGPPILSAATPSPPLPPATTRRTEASPSQPPATSRPVFQISNSVKYLKPQLMEAIAQLGGVVDVGAGYSRDCRFLVAAEGITERTEKYLGACAAAVHIVPPRYVFDSQRRGYWLTNRVQDYDMSPQRRLPHTPRAPPIFSSWRVVLVTCRTAAARGVRAALLAGGCGNVTAFVVDMTAEVPFTARAESRVVSAASAVDGVVEGVCPTSVIDAATLRAATHILIECSSVTPQGFFQLPDWVPVCLRHPDYTSRIFTLELLYFCLCAHPERIFDEEGLLCDGEALTPACRVEPL